MPRQSRHGWTPRRQPEHIIRTGVAVIITVLIILTAFAAFGANGH